MKFIITKNYDELSRVMCQNILSHMYSNNERINIALTTGKTCLKGYKYLSSEINNKLYFENVNYYIFDEFYFKSENYKETLPVCRISLDKEFFRDAHIKESQIHDLTFENYKTFDHDIIKNGGFDLVIMGVGSNGHFCGNQPGTFSNWNDGTRLVKTNQTEYLKNYSKKLLKNDFNSTDEKRIPSHYITMGPKTIMNAKHIIFILNGDEKAEVVKKAFFSPISDEFPVSIFQLHQNVTVILDEKAANLIKDII
ncbi:MAG: 6-phosphogluconolactonase [Bacilli bacterium]|uniref:6-phosphogluconolactonase n=1 Tax=Anaerorhabdus sp. TaxID=1872524 RepID=UPI002FC5F710